jgi:hypothetical protein
MRGTDREPTGKEKWTSPFRQSAVTSILEDDTAADLESTLRSQMHASNQLFLFVIIVSDAKDSRDISQMSLGGLMPGKHRTHSSNAPINGQCFAKTQSYLQTKRQNLKQSSIPTCKRHWEHSGMYRQCISIVKEHAQKR